MRLYEKTNLLVVCGIILTVGFGCKMSELKKITETVEEPKKTVITKEILTERLAVRLVKTAESPSDKSGSQISTADARKVDIREDNSSRGKPNPLTLQLRFATANNNFLLNNEPLKNFGELANLLKNVFRERENNGIFIEGTNDIYNKITLSANQKLIDEYNSKNIFVEDFEKLVDDLRNENFGQIELDVNENTYLSKPDAPKNTAVEARRKLTVDSPSEPRQIADIKTISGGVLNGKAVELPKPAYPSAARAVRASGAVNVQITVDENGDVSEAKAVSGHPLLRAAAIEAAQSAKFNPTLLGGKAVRVKGIVVYNFVP